MTRASLGCRTEGSSPLTATAQVRDGDLSVIPCHELGVGRASRTVSTHSTELLDGPGPPKSLRVSTERYQDRGRVLGAPSPIARVEVEPLLVGKARRGYSDETSPGGGGRRADATATEHLSPPFSSRRPLQIGTWVTPFHRHEARRYETLALVRMHEDEIEIDERLVRHLLSTQVPYLAHHPLTKVAPWGTDNAGLATRSRSRRSSPPYPLGERASELGGHMASTLRRIPTGRHSRTDCDRKPGRRIPLAMGGVPMAARRGGGPDDNPRSDEICD